MLLMKNGGYKPFIKSEEHQSLYEDHSKSKNKFHFSYVDKIPLTSENKKHILSLAEEYYELKMEKKK